MIQRARASDAILDQLAEPLTRRVVERLALGPQTHAELVAALGGRGVASSVSRRTSALADAGLVVDRDRHFVLAAGEVLDLLDLVARTPAGVRLWRRVLRYRHGRRILEALVGGPRTQAQLKRQAPSQRVAEIIDRLIDLDMLERTGADDEVCALLKPELVYRILWSADVIAAGIHRRRSDEALFYAYVRNARVAGIRGRRGDAALADVPEPPINEAYRAPDGKLFVTPDVLEGWTLAVYPLGLLGGEMWWHPPVMPAWVDAAAGPADASDPAGGEPTRRD